MDEGTSFHIMKRCMMLLKYKDNGNTVKRHSYQAWWFMLPLWFWKEEKRVWRTLWQKYIVYNLFAGSASQREKMAVHVEYSAGFFSSTHSTYRAPDHYSSPTRNHIKKKKHLCIQKLPDDTMGGVQRCRTLQDKYDSKVWCAHWGRNKLQKVPILPSHSCTLSED